MELRRRIGNRVMAAPYVAPYLRGPIYRVAHACFDCRKSWKVLPDRAPVCPQCALPLREMGRAFRAPAKTNIKQWKKVEALWNQGFRFWSVGSTEVEPLPEKLADVQDFIRRNPNHPARLRSYRPG
jgi:hypothetical protein